MDTNDASTSKLWLKIWIVEVVQILYANKELVWADMWKHTKMSHHRFIGNQQELAQYEDRALMNEDAKGTDGTLIVASFCEDCS